MPKNYRTILGAFGLLMAIIIFLSCIAGCSQVEKKSVVMGRIDGDVWIRSIGSDNQFHQDGVASAASLETPGVPGTQIPPISASYNTTGMFAGHSVRIEYVSGSVFIEEAINRNQGIDVSKSLEKLFEPGDPFAVAEQ